MLSSREPLPSHAVRVGAFVVQTQVERDAGRVELTRVPEDRGAGEQRASAGRDELARLVAEWAARSAEPP